MAMGEQQRASALRPRCQWPGCLRPVARGIANQTHCSAHFQLLHDARDGNEPDIEEPQPIAPKKRGRPPAPKPVPAPAPPCPSADLDLFADDMVSEYVLDGMVDRCEFCGALNFPAESVGTGAARRVTLCCKGGKLSHLPPIPDAPEPLRSWLLAPDARGRAFRNNIRRYNAALSFVSFGANVEVRGGHAQPHAPLPPKCFRIGYKSYYPLLVLWSLSSSSRSTLRSPNLVSMVASCDIWLSWKEDQCVWDLIFKVVASNHRFSMPSHEKQIES